MSLTDYLASLIRTVVPAAIGTAVTWFQIRLGLTVDEASQAGFVAATTGFTISLYYALVRRAEQRWPAVGWLLGLAKAPEYEVPPAA